jgi:hypothetical protein
MKNPYRAMMVAIIRRFVSHGGEYNMNGGLYSFAPYVSKPFI